MPFHDESLTEEQLKEMVETHRCNECGERVRLAWGGAFGIDGYVLRCNDLTHSTIAPKGRTAVKADETYEEKIRRQMELEEKVGQKTSTALARLPVKGQLTQPQAEKILSLVYPGCPKDEIIRCAILCRDFGLHPLMKEVYLIPFKKKDRDGKVIGEDYATVLGINATRKLMAQRGSYSYFDDTPRLMTGEEQKRIFGEVDGKNIVAITKLRTKDGLEAPGYGRWPNNKEPYGADKGNTGANMAFIRSERNAFGRLSPDALPQGVEIIDEAYAELPEVGSLDTETGEIIEGKVVEPKEKEAKSKSKTKAKAKEPEEAQAELITGPTGTGKDKTPITTDQLTHITDLMKESGMDLAAIGKYFNVDKGWKIRLMGDLVKWQYDEIVKAFEKR